MEFSANSLISVCIPVFNAECTLRRCLESVAVQSYTNWELIIVNDGSLGTDENGYDCYKIVKQFKKEFKSFRKKIIYLEHRTNLGLLEARRSLVLSSHGEYITMLDADDALLPDALMQFFNAAQKSNADIIHGGTEIISNSQSYTDSTNQDLIKKRVMQMTQKTNNIYVGELFYKDIFEGYLIQNNHIGFLWGKLIKKALYEKALSYIPFSKCVFAEDFLQYFFISFEAKKYYGIKEKVYSYSVDTGISSFNKITNLNKWEQICSTATVFSIIFSVIKEFPENTFSMDEMEAVRASSRSYLANNINQLRAEVIPELQPAARQMLCDYWGENFVETMEKAMTIFADTAG